MKNNPLSVFCLILSKSFLKLLSNHVTLQILRSEYLLVDSYFDEESDVEFSYFRAYFGILNIRISLLSISDFYFTSLWPL